jgi:Lrp/AsnC family transcriptional regulator, leucine-responsive regulatory protein
METIKDLDNLDLKIIKILQQEGRITNLQLSHDIGLSPAPTLERVRKLENYGFIKSYHAKVDEKKLGVDIVTFVKVKLNSYKSDAMRSFINQVKEVDEITECYYVTGSADFILKLMVPDMSSYERLIFDKMSKIQEIGNMETMVVLSEVKNSNVVPINYNRPTR